MYLHQKVIVINNHKLYEGVIIGVTERTKLDFGTVSDLQKLRKTDYYNNTDTILYEVAFMHEDGDIISKTFLPADVASSIWSFEDRVVKLPELTNEAPEDE